MGERSSRILHEFVNKSPGTIEKQAEESEIQSNNENDGPQAFSGRPLHFQDCVNC